MAAWDRYLTEEDRQVIAKGRFGRRVGMGNRPAVVAIDCQKYMVGEQGRDADWPSSCGAVGRAGLLQAARVVEAAQTAGLPVFFTLFELDPKGRDIGIYGRKRDLLESESWCLAGTRGAELADVLRPGANDLVFVKKKPSAFFGTPLMAYLTARRIDTVVVVGGATSNCVRATVFDSASLNFRTIVAEEAVFDRLPVSHAISLFDMDRQFADVMPVADIVETFAAHHAGDAAGHS